jgi:acetylxylan esterase
MFSSLTLRNLLALGNLFFVTNGALTPVTDFGSNPTGLTMDIYAPNKLATNPAVILAVSDPNQSWTFHD